MMREQRQTRGAERTTSTWVALLLVLVSVFLGVSPLCAQVGTVKTVTHQGAVGGPSKMQCNDPCCAHRHPAPAMPSRTACQLHCDAAAVPVTFVTVAPSMDAEPAVTATLFVFADQAYSDVSRADSPPPLTSPSFLVPLRI